MNSNTWAIRKSKYFKFFPKKCAACDSEENIHLHHLTYVRMGYEFDSDLAALCEPCHNNVHEIHKKLKGSSSLQDVTFRYIATYKSPPKRRRKKPAQKQSAPKVTHTLRAGRTDPVNIALSKIEEVRK